MSQNKSNAALVSEKGKNKRKHLSDQLTQDLSAAVSKLSITEFPKYENLVEKLQNAVDECEAIIQGSNEDEGYEVDWDDTASSEYESSEDEKDPEWDNPVAVELGELLSHNLYITFSTAIKKIEECGYTKEIAEWAILNSSFIHGNKDDVSNLFRPALAFLKKHKVVNTPTHSLFDGLHSLIDYMLLEMVFVVREVRPELSVAEAMWALLINDLNIMNACSMNHQQSTSKPGGGESSATQKESS